MGSEDKNKFIKLIEEIFNPDLPKDFAELDEKYGYVITGLANQIKNLKIDRDHYKNLFEDLQEREEEIKTQIEEYLDERIRLQIGCETVAYTRGELFNVQSQIQKIFGGD